MGVFVGHRAKVQAAGPQPDDQDPYDCRRPVHDRQGLLREDWKLRPSDGHLGRGEPR